MNFWRRPLDYGQVEPSHYRIRVQADLCKGCGFCIQFCPTKALDESAEFNAKGYHPVCAANENNCVGCGFCEMICPEFAIWTVLDEQPGGP